MAVNAEVVDAVLKTWANSYVEDVPAVHEGGKYLIEYDTLVEHLNSLSYADLISISLEAEEG